MRKQNGFTLLEMLTALVVASAITTTGVPAMNKMLAKQRIEAAASSLKLQLQLMRSQAIKENHNTYISFAHDGANWSYGLDDNTPCDPVDDNCTVNGVDKVFSGGAWRGVQMSQNLGGNVGFEPRRGMASHSGTITLTSKAGTMKVAISPIGHISICTPAGSGITGYSTCG